MTRKLITISGPTASGKTKNSILIAKKIEEALKAQAVIINFDSLLFYQELSIGTAKPSLSERMGIEHRLIDISSAKSPLNAADYVHMAETEIEKCFAQNQIPILVGGSGFYLRALIKGMFEAPTPPASVKDEVDRIIAEEGAEAIRHRLEKCDPKSFERLHPNDLYRNSRALEFFLTTGKPISEEHSAMEAKDPYDFSRDCAHDWDCLHLYLDLPKPLHWNIIHQRTSEMIESGLIDEVKMLLKNGFSAEDRPLQSIGYKETIDYLEGKLTSQEELIERIDISTRQLAKSQRTFFKKMIPKHCFSPLEDPTPMLQLVLDYLN